jgi:hypothetical protein
MDSAEMKRVRDSFLREDPPPPESVTERPKRIRDSIRREDPDDEPVGSERARGPDSAGQRMSWGPEATTGTHRRRSHRLPVKVDEVGAAAVKLARTTRRESAPELVASRATVAKAPIDSREAFVLSLVDGRNTVDAIVDMSGMSADEVNAILARLARLGLISLP